MKKCKRICSLNSFLKIINEKLKKYRKKIVFTHPVIYISASSSSASIQNYDIKLRFNRYQVKKNLQQHKNEIKYTK